MAHNPPGGGGQSCALTSKPRALVVSAAWVVFFMLASWVLSTLLGVIREFEPNTEFDACNRIHWFRPIAFFWFTRYSVLPSIVPALVICCRHALPRARTIVTWVLALLSAFILGVGGYTVWQRIGFMECFTS